MHCVEEASGDTWVALRKESVDRNLLRKITITVDEGSLSARRAWIEMFFSRSLFAMFRVALRKESVDRNGSAWVQEFPEL